MSEEIRLQQLDGTAPPPTAREFQLAGELRRLSAVPVDLTVEMGRARMTVGETLELRQGSIITLNPMAGEPVDLLVNEMLGDAARLERVSAEQAAPGPETAEEAA